MKECQCEARVETALMVAEQNRKFSRYELRVRQKDRQKERERGSSRGVRSLTELVPFRPFSKQRA